MGYFYPDRPKDITWDTDVKYFTKKLQEGTLYGGQITKMVEDSTGKAVAFAAWQYPHHLTPEQKAEKDRNAEEAKKEPHPPGAQGPLIEDFFNNLLAGRKKWINPEKTYCKSASAPSIPFA